MTTRAEAYSMYATEYVDFDGVEEVTITSVDDADLEITGVMAKQLPLEHAARPAGGMESDVESIERKWIIFDATLDGETPEHGWILTQTNGDAWTMGRSIQRLRWDTQWHCQMTKTLADP